MNLKQVFIISFLILFCIAFIFHLPRNNKDPVREDNTGISIYFCQQDSCSTYMSRLIKSSNTSVRCAFFDLELENIINTIKNTDYKLVIDKRNTEDIEGRLSYAANKNTKQLMHNKFCVIDEKITVTGSFNPTERGDTKNDNNIIIIKSGYIAKNYLDEFSELYRSTFASGKKTKHPIIYLNGTKIENYFCPEDSCADHVIDTILQADKSIDFMTFSFTHDSIGDAIITQHKNNIKIRGIFETTQNNKWTEYKRLKSAGISVTWDKNPYNMHHKVFIIDNEIVITGSFNPSRSGDERNDENILIIHSKEIAEKYEKEFERLFR